MRKYTLFFILLFIKHVAFSQKHDNLWIHIQPGEDTTGSSPLDPPYPAAFMYFDSSPARVVYAQTLYPGDDCNLVICDEKGTPLFFSNGYNIFHIDGPMMENGDSLAPIIFQSGYPFGDPKELSLMALPRSEHDGDYYIIQLYTEPNWNYTPKLLLSYISGATALDLGKVQYKNKLLFTGHDRIFSFNATRHANGRDWWIVFPDIDVTNKTRTFHSILLGRDTIYVAQSQSINGYEPVSDHPWEVYINHIVFSPNGEYFISLDYVNGIRIHPFDRCTGMLGPLTTLPYQLGHWGAGGVAVSPNSRYLYVSNSDYIFQYDLQAPDIVASKDTVAIYDGYLEPPAGIPVIFNRCQLGPDGKIYFFCPSTGWVNIVNQPNEKGSKCRLMQRAFLSPVENILPFYPNYRLGPIDGSACDSLGLNNEPLADFWWFADSTLTVEFADNSSYEPAQWHWAFGDGGISQDTNPVHTFPAPGTYQVCLRVSNAYAADTICKMVHVGATTAAGQAAGDTFGVLVYPNPAHESMRVQYRFQRPNAWFTLYDATGRIAFDHQLPDREGRIELNTAPLPPGFYFYRVENDGGRTWSGKMIIGH